MAYERVIVHCYALYIRAIKYTESAAVGGRQRAANDCRWLLSTRVCTVMHCKRARSNAQNQK